MSSVSKDSVFYDFDSQMCLNICCFMTYQNHPLVDESSSVTSDVNNYNINGNVASFTGRFCSKSNPLSFHSVSLASRRMRWLLHYLWRGPWMPMWTWEISSAWIPSLVFSWGKSSVTDLFYRPCWRDVFVCCALGQFRSYQSLNFYVKRKSYVKYNRAMN